MRFLTRLTPYTVSIHLGTPNPAYDGPSTPLVRSLLTELFIRRGRRGFARAPRSRLRPWGAAPAGFRVIHCHVAFIRLSTDRAGCAAEILPSGPAGPLR